MPWSTDFKSIAERFTYQRDPDKILHKERYDGHAVHTRNVREAWTPVDVLFVGEAPGDQEDRQGIPFIGRSGDLLRRTIEDERVFTWPRDRVGITNIVGCRPPRNRDPSNTEVKSCAPELLREIRARKPKLIVVLGNHSLEFFTERTGITAVCGKLMDSTRPEFAGIKILACIHPAFVLRFNHELERFAGAIHAASEFLHGRVEVKPGIGTYDVVTELTDLKRWIQRYRSGKATVAFDTETGSLSAFQTEFPALLCFSFSDKEQTAIVVPFDHAESPWRAGGEKEHERKEVTALLGSFFGDPKVAKVAQNKKFDSQHIRKAVGVTPVNVLDTMISHYVLDETRGTHGLDVLALLYTGMGGYEKPLERYIDKHKEANPKKGGSYANIPGSMLFPYAGADADCTLRVHHALRKEPQYQENKRFQVLAEKFLPAVSETLANMEFRGAKVDMGVMDSVGSDLQRQMEGELEALRSLRIVRQYEAMRQARGLRGEDCLFNPNSDNQVREVLFECLQFTSTSLTDGGDDRVTARTAKKLALVENEHLDWNELRKLRKQIRTDVIAAAVKQKEWGIFSVDADTLYQYEHTGDEFSKRLLAYRKAETAYSTFFEPMRERLDANGLVHGSFSLTTVVTGRLASSSPNLQNIPPIARGGYVSRFGADGLIGNIDQSQIELRVAACWFEDPSMIRAYRDGADLHHLTTLAISGLTNEQYEALSKEERKLLRTKAKNANFGALFGAGPAAIQKALRKAGVFLGLEECAELIERFYEARPFLKRNIDRHMQRAKKLGYVETFTGRRRRIPEVTSTDEYLVGHALRQAVNSPIQGGASDITLMAMVLIERELRERRLKSLLTLNVHDAVVFDLYSPESLEVMQLGKAIMENVPELSDQVCPGIDWKWLKVPLVAECEMGLTWNSTVPFDPFNVDVDALWTKMAEAA